MIVRDLLVGPKRFGDIQRGLPGIPTNILTARLNELEEAGLVERRVAVRPSRGVLYALTDGGRDLDEAVIAIGRWGAKRLEHPRDGEIITQDSIATALRSTFRPKSARNITVSYLLKLGDIQVGARVRGGKLKITRGPIEHPDLLIETGPALRSLLAQDITPKEALDKRLVGLTGDPALFERFVDMFRI